jgi:hypothetical protein
MNFGIIQILLTMVAYTIVASMIITDATDAPAFELPTLEIPDFTFLEYADVSAGCGGFTDCIGWLAAIVQNIGTTIYNIAIGLIGTLVLIFNLIVYIVELVALIFATLIGGIDGAPWYANIFITLPFLASVGLIVYKLLRKGESTA